MAFHVNHLDRIHMKCQALFFFLKKVKKKNKKMLSAAKSFTCLGIEKCFSMP